MDMWVAICKGRRLGYTRRQIESQSRAGTQAPPNEPTGRAFYTSASQAPKEGHAATGTVRKLRPSRLQKAYTPLKVNNIRRSERFLAVFGGYLFLSLRRERAGIHRLLRFSQMFLGFPLRCSC